MPRDVEPCRPYRLLPPRAELDCLSICALRRLCRVCFEPSVYVRDLLRAALCRVTERKTTRRLSMPQRGAERHRWRRS